MPETDAELVARVVAGNPGDFRALVHRYQEPVFRFAYNLIGGRQDAEEIAQDVFVAAFRNLERFDDSKASLTTWLLTITRNRCINHLRKRTLSTSPINVDIASNQPETMGALETIEFRQQLDEALDALPAKQKATFVLAEIEQLPYADIALIEQTTLGTVKSRLHRAKRALRAMLESPLRES